MQVVVGLFMFLLDSFMVYDLTAKLLGQLVAAAMVVIGACGAFGSHKKSRNLLNLHIVGVILAIMLGVQYITAFSRDNYVNCSLARLYVRVSRTACSPAPEETNRPTRPPEPLCPSHLPSPLSAASCSTRPIYICNLSTLSSSSYAHGPPLYPSAFPGLLPLVPSAAAMQSLIQSHGGHTLLLSFSPPLHCRHPPCRFLHPPIPCPTPSHLPHPPHAAVTPPPPPLPFPAPC